MTTMREQFLQPNEASDIANYVAEEVRRQGDGPLDVGYMLDAWYNAVVNYDEGLTLSLNMIRGWAAMIDPLQNTESEYSFRQSAVRVGLDVKPYENIERQMGLWLEAVLGGYFEECAVESGAHIPGPDLAYKAFEDIHPFYDGNGRTGKIIFNWLNDSLRAPMWPYNFWGVANP